MEIQGKKVTTENNYLDPVTYVPEHVQGNAGHSDCEQGVIIAVNDPVVKVLYCKERTVQSTYPIHLVFG